MWFIVFDSPPAWARSAIEEEKACNDHDIVISACNFDFWPAREGRDE